MSAHMKGPPLDKAMEWFTDPTPNKTLSCSVVLAHVIGNTAPVF
jgi:hypothetical protein